MDHKNNRFENGDRWQSVSLSAFFVLIISAATSVEANWQVSPEIGVGVGYDDNIFLNDFAGSTASQTDYGIDALVDFFYDTQLTDFTITPRLRSTRYIDDSDLDSDDQFLNFDFIHQRQKSRFRFRGSYASESVRTAERSEVDFGIEDPDEIPVDDTGRVFDTGKRDRLRLVPQFSYDLTQRTSLSISGNYIDSSYDDDVSLFLADYAEYSVGTSLGYSWSERDTISLKASAGKFELDGSNTESTSNAYGIGYERKLSERTLFRLIAGSDTSEDGSGNDETNPVGEISVIHRYATTSVIASYRRTTNGTGSGNRSLRDAVSLTVSRDVSPRLNLGGGVRAYSTDSLSGSDAGFAGRDYLQVRALARWNFSRTASIHFDYRYTKIDRNVEGISQSNGDSNQVGVWFYWRPNPLRR